MGDRITAALTDFDVHEIRGRYDLIEPRDGRAVARLKPIPDADRVALLSWPFARERWKTSGPLGPVRLEFHDVVDVVRHDPMFRITPTGSLASLFG